jgi:hypothetical protein
MIFFNYAKANKKNALKFCIFPSNNTFLILKKDRQELVVVIDFCSRLHDGVSSFDDYFFGNNARFKLKLLSPFL